MCIKPVPLLIIAILIEAEKPLSKNQPVIQTKNCIVKIDLFKAGFWRLGIYARFDSPAQRLVASGAVPANSEIKPLNSGKNKSSRENYRTLQNFDLRTENQVLTASEEQNTFVYEFGV
jgi:hypothetical protein